MNLGITKSKTVLRQKMREVRKLLDEKARRSAEKALCQNVLQTLDAHGASARCIAVYLAKWPEASVDETIRVLISSGIKVCAPREGENGPQFAVFNSLDRVELNARGVREPQGEEVSPGKIDVVIVPGLAFDSSGARLGQGGGWYDRVLQQMPCATKIGVGLECQMMENLPQEAHDIRMNFVVTEGRVVRLENL